MPLTGFKPQCKYCDTFTSSIWRKEGGNDYICQSCFVHQDSKKQDESIANGTKSKFDTRPYRASTRQKSIRSKVVPKGKSRRSAYKIKHATKMDKIEGCITTSSFIIHKGQYFQSGDIVSVIDADNHKVYFAQCNAFMTNEYFEKFLTFTWLLPIKKLDTMDKFDPSCFYLGPSDELIRSMNCVEYVCHAPSDYYKHQSSAYVTFPTSSKNKGYISVNLT